MRYYLLGALAALVVVGCGPKSEETAAAPAPTNNSVAPPPPDVGKLDSVSVTALTGLQDVRGTNLCRGYMLTDTGS